MFFDVAMAIGVFGLLAMALPGFRRHGGHLHAGGKLGGKLGGAKVHPGGHVQPGAHQMVKAGGKMGSAAGGRLGHLTIPEPHAILAMLALFGAFGNIFEHVGLHLGLWEAGLAAVVPAALIEVLAVGPLWRWALGFQGKTATPLAALVLEEAHAVTAFHNGRGIVQVVRDGRTVQLPAQLVEKHADAQVKVGDRLRVQDVEAEKERVLVSVD